MADPLPIKLKAIGTVLAELAIGAVTAIWWLYPPSSGLGVLIAPAIALGAFFVLFIVIGLLWTKRRDGSRPSDEAR